MRIMTIVGTRPELIRLSRTIPLLDKHFDHILVHTGQNYDKNLKDIFFEEMEIRQPNVQIDISGGSWYNRVGEIISHCGSYIQHYMPDKLLVLGDTDSALSTLAAKRLGIPVYHMEAGNRCRDDKVPEEVNRRVIDQCSDILMPYTERSRYNLLREGFAENKIFVIGNPIYEVIKYYMLDDKNSAWMESPEWDDIYKKVYGGGFYLVTIHRAENVDDEDRLRCILDTLVELSKEAKVVVSTHPRTKARIDALLKVTARYNDKFKNVLFERPFGFRIFLELQKMAMCVITDSGTVQEECSILKIPNVTFRTTTERPETVEYGHNIIAGMNTESVINAVKLAMSSDGKNPPPQGYMRPDVSSTVCKILMGV